MDNAYDLKRLGSGLSSEEIARDLKEYSGERGKNKQTLRKKEIPVKCFVILIQIRICHFSGLRISNNNK